MQNDFLSYKILRAIFGGFISIFLTFIAIFIPAKIFPDIFNNDFFISSLIIINGFLGAIFSFLKQKIFNFITGFFMSGAIIFFMTILVLELFAKNIFMVNYWYIYNFIFISAGILALLTLKNQNIINGILGGSIALMVSYFVLINFIYEEPFLLFLVSGVLIILSSYFSYQSVFILRAVFLGFLVSVFGSLIISSDYFFSLLLFILGFMFSFNLEKITKIYVLKKINFLFEVSFELVIAFFTGIIASALILNLFFGSNIFLMQNENLINAISGALLVLFTLVFIFIKNKKFRKRKKYEEK